MEKNFLFYLLYIALVDIRERSFEKKDSYTFGLCDLLHNIPLQLTSEANVKDAYEYLLDNAKELGMEKWMETRKEEFYSRFPEYKNSNCDTTQVLRNLFNYFLTLSSRNQIFS
jgi:hypothetical protein